MSEFKGPVKITNNCEWDAYYVKYQKIKEA